MPRFALLRHECPPDSEKASHWDLMLEQGQSLATWELQELPTSWARLLEPQPIDDPQAAPAETVSAIRLPDHRLAYLDYEGLIGEDRGKVRQCDGGTYELLARQEDALTFCLSGSSLAGEVQLSRNGSDWELKIPSSQQAN